MTDDVTYCCTVHVNYRSSFSPSIYGPQSNTSVFENQAKASPEKLQGIHASNPYPTPRFFPTQFSLRRSHNMNAWIRL